MLVLFSLSTRSYLSVCLLANLLVHFLLLSLSDYYIEVEWSGCVVRLLLLIIELATVVESCDFIIGSK